MNINKFALQKIFELAKEKNLNKQDLAKIMKIRTKTFSRIVLEQSELKILMIVRLCQYFKISLYDFFKDFDDTN